MNISLSARHMSLSEQTKTYTSEKVEKLERVFDRITDLKIVLSKDGAHFGCEIIVGLPSHKNVIISKEAENLYTAIDDAVNICEQKLKQYKTRRRDMKGHLHDLPQDN